MTAHSYMKSFVESLILESPEQFSLFKKFKYLYYVYTGDKYTMPEDLSSKFDKRARSLLAECLEELKIGYYQWLMDHATPVDVEWESYSVDYEEIRDMDAVSVYLSRIFSQVDAQRYIRVDIRNQQVLFTYLSRSIDITEIIQNEFNNWPLQALAVLFNGEDLEEALDEIYGEEEDEFSESITLEMDKETLREEIETAMEAIPEIIMSLESKVVDLILEKIPSVYRSYEYFIRDEFWGHEVYLKILRMYQEFYPYDPTSHSIREGLRLVDRAINTAHHNGTMGDHIDLTKLEQDSLGNIKVPPLDTPEDYMNFYSELF